MTYIEISALVHLIEAWIFVGETWNLLFHLIKKNGGSFQSYEEILNGMFWFLMPAFIQFFSQWNQHVGGFEREKLDKKRNFPLLLDFLIVLAWILKITS